MQQSLEIELQNRIYQGEDLEAIAEDLCLRLYDKKLRKDELWSLFHFLFHSGLDRKLIELAISLADQKKLLPYPHLIEIFHRNKVRPSSSFVESLSKGARKQELVEEFVRSSKWDKLDSRIPEYRKTILEQKRSEVLKQKERLLEKVGFFKAQMMLEEEKRTLRILQRLAPADPKLPPMMEDFDQRWARHVLSRRAASHLESLEKTQTATTLEEKAAARKIADEIRKLCRQDPRWAYNFSIGLMFMELFDEALDILQKSPRDLASDWLRVELSLLNRHFVDALEEVSYLENKYAEDPETVFSSSYARAKALKGLGQIQSAIEILRSIINVRPTYRSASSLLADWSRGTG